MSANIIDSVACRPLRLIHGGGQPFDNTPVADIWSCGLAEDELTLCVWINLVDGRTVLLSIKPGSPVYASVVSEPNAMCLPGKRP